MKAYRVEDQSGGHGIWRNFDGSLNPVFKKLSDGLAKNLPMPDSDFYHHDGKQWFSATDTPDKLTAWFSRQDVLEMLAMGYQVWEFDITSCRVVSEYEIVFTRDSIVSQRVIDWAEIWKED